MKLSIIVPVYNEEKTIATVIDKLLSLSIQSTIIEIVIVNDGSSDNTFSQLKKYKSLKKITIINSEKNKGKGIAVMKGISHATGDYVIIQDADLEYDPQQISKLVGKISENSSVVIYGTRLNRMPHLKKEEARPRFLLHYI